MTNTQHDRKPRIITGGALIDQLEALGAIPKGLMYRRVVIDAPFDGAVIIYVELAGDDRLIAEPLTAALGAHVVMVGAKREGRPLESA